VSAGATRNPGKGAALFFFGAFVSMFGSDMNATAVQWAVYEWTGREDYIGFLLALPILAAILAMPWVGVFIDRHDRRVVGIALDVVRGVIVLATPLALALGADRVVAVTVMTFGVLFLTSAYWPNAQTLVQEVSSPERHVRSSGFFAGSVQGGSLVAGVLVGALYASIGLPGLLLVDAATYAVSATCFALMPRGAGEPKTDVAAPADAASVGSFAAFVRDVKEGLSFLASAPAVLRLGVAQGLILAGVFGLQVVTAPINRDLLHAGALEFGYCNGAWGLGALCGSQLAVALFRRVRPAVAFAPAMLLIAAAAASIPVVRQLSFGVTAFFLMGVGRGAGGVVILSRFLHDVPRRVMGRVQSAVQAFSLVLRVIVMIATGLLAQHGSLVAAIVANASFFVLAALVAPPAREKRALAAAP